MFSLDEITNEVYSLVGNNFNYSNKEKNYKYISHCM